MVPACHRLSASTLDAAISDVSQRRRVSFQSVRVSTRRHSLSDRHVQQEAPDFHRRPASARLNPDVT
jgi:hypothetical protein